MADLTPIEIQITANAGVATEAIDVTIARVKKLADETAAANKKIAESSARQYREMAQNSLAISRGHNQSVNDYINNLKTAQADRLTIIQNANDEALASFNNELAAENKMLMDSITLQAEERQKQANDAKAVYDKQVADLKAANIAAANASSAANAKRIADQRATDAAIAKSAQETAAKEIAAAEAVAANQAGISKRLETSGMGLARIGGRLSYSLTLPMAMFGYASLKSANDFNTSMTKVASLTNATASQVNAWKKEVIDLGNKYGVTGKNAADALYMIASNGVKGQAATDALNYSLKASAVGLGTSADTARLAASMMQAYSKDGVTAKQATDVLVASVKEGHMQTDQLVGSMGRVLAVAQQSGVSMSDLGAAFAVTSREGANASNVAAELSGMFKQLIAPSKGVEKSLESVGLTARGMRQEMKDKGLLATLMDLHDRFLKVTGSQQKAVDAMGSVFKDVRGLRGVFTILTQNTDELKTAFNNVHNSTGALDEAFKKTSQSSAFQFHQAIVNLKNSMIDLGAALAPILTKFASFITALVSKFQALSPSVKNFIAILLVVGAALGPVMAAIGSFVAALGMLMSPIGLVIAAVGLFVLALNTGNPALRLAAAAVAALTAALAANKIVTSVISAYQALSAALTGMFVPAMTAATAAETASAGSVAGAITSYEALTAVLTGAVIPAVEATTAAETEMAIAEGFATGGLSLIAGAAALAGVGLYLASNNANTAAKSFDVTKTAIDQMNGSLDSVPKHAAVAGRGLQNLGFYLDNAKVKAEQAALAIYDVSTASNKGIGYNVQEKIYSISASEDYMKGEILTATKNRIAANKRASDKAQQDALDAELKKLAKQQGGAGGASGAAGNSAKQLAAQNRRQIMQTYTSALADVKAAAKQFVSDIKNVTSGAISEFTTGGAGTPMIKTAVEQAFGGESNVSSAVSQFDSLASSIRNYWTNYEDMYNKANKTTLSFNDVAQSMVDNLQNAVQKSVTLMNSITADQDAIAQAQNDAQIAAQNINDKYDVLDRQASDALKALNAYYDTLIPTLQSKLDETNKAFSDANDVLQGLIDARKSAMDSIKSGFMSFMNDLNLDPYAATFKRSLQNRLGDVKEFTAGIKKLMQAGLNQDLVQQLIQAGPGIAGPGGVLRQLLQASPEDIAAMNATQAELQAQISDFQTAVSAQFHDAAIAQQQAIVDPLKAAADAAQAALDLATRTRDQQIAAQEASQQQLRDLRDQEIKDSDKYYRELEDGLNKHIDQTKKDLDTNATTINGLLVDMGVSMSKLSHESGLAAITALRQGFDDKIQNKILQDAAVYKAQMTKDAIDATFKNQQVAAVQGSTYTPATTASIGGTTVNNTTNINTVVQGYTGDPAGIAQAIAWQARTGALA